MKLFENRESMALLIGGEIHNRRIQVGLAQEQLVKFAGLSRVTINQLENGTLADLGYTKLKAVMDVLSLDMKAMKFLA